MFGHDEPSKQRTVDPRVRSLVTTESVRSEKVPISPWKKPVTKEEIQLELFNKQTSELDSFLKNAQKMSEQHAKSSLELESLHEELTPLEMRLTELQKTYESISSRSKSSPLTKDDMSNLQMYLAVRGQVAPLKKREIELIEQLVELKTNHQLPKLM